MLESLGLMKRQLTLGCFTCPRSEVNNGDFCGFGDEQQKIGVLIILIELQRIKIFYRHHEPHCIRLELRVNYVPLRLIRLGHLM